MGIHREAEFEYVLYCEVCGYTADPVNTFEEAVSLKKELEWTSQKVQGEWEDVCSKCKTKILKKKLRKASKES